LKGRFEENGMYPVVSDVVMLPSSTTPVCFVLDKNKEMVQIEGSMGTFDFECAPPCNLASDVEAEASLIESLTNEPELVPEPEPAPEPEPVRSKKSSKKIPDDEA